jgi:hypothetical protein
MVQRNMKRTYVHIILDIPHSHNLSSTPLLLRKKLNMANTHPRCYPPGVNTGVLAACDRMTTNNNSIIVNKSTIIWREQLIQAQATKPPNINPL